jgi:hypothetical protein
MVNVFEATGCTSATGPLGVTAPAEMGTVAVTVTEVALEEGSVRQRVPVDTATNSTGITVTLDDFADPANQTLFFVTHGKGNDPILDATGDMEVVAHHEGASLFSIATLFAPEPVLDPEASWGSTSSPTALGLELSAT